MILYGPPQMTLVSPALIFALCQRRGILPADPVATLSIAEYHRSVSYLGQLMLFSILVQTKGLLRY